MTCPLRNTSGISAPRPGQKPPSSKLTTAVDASYYSAARIRVGFEIDVIDEYGSCHAGDGRKRWTSSSSRWNSSY